MKFHSSLSTVVSVLAHLAWATNPAPSASSAPTELLVSAQLGPYPVAIYDHEIKTSRPDPLAPDSQLRRLMVTVYRPFLDNFTCPLEDLSHTPYLPPVVADAIVKFLPGNNSSSTTGASSIFEAVKVVNCSRPIPSSPRLSSSVTFSSPLLLFSHGLGGTHHIYSYTLLAAASSGYTVIAIDHTYEAAAVVFPDGYVAYANSSIVSGELSTDKGLNYLQTVRNADTVSVLDAIERGEVPGLAHYTNSTSSSSSSFRVAMFGHSLGGSTAANVAALDARVSGAINMDGTFFGPVANTTVRKPLLMVGSSESDPAWQTYYSNHVRGWKTWVQPKNIVHYGFTDLPQLADLLGVRGTLLPEEIIGTIDSRRLQEIVWRYTQEFFAYVLRDTVPDLLIKASTNFPDVNFVGHKEADKGNQ